MKALIAMSGGVDSSVAALLMINKGYDCTGVTVNFYDRSEKISSNLGDEYTFQDAVDARSICDRLGMKHIVLDYSHDFEEKVIGYFVDCYKNGRTPNPCVECNKYFKFGKLYDYAMENGYDCLVTGHYASIDSIGDGRYMLKKAADDTKDQSYMLWNLKPEMLSHIEFPLGSYTKSQVKMLAEYKNFVTAHKKESMDICFVESGDYSDVIKKYSEGDDRQGNFVDRFGKILGTHKGITHYTIGQHRRLGIALGKTVYVTKIDPTNNTITLGDEEDLFTNECIIKDFNRVFFAPLGETKVCSAKIRYAAKPADCTVYFGSDNTARVVFDEKLRAITSGQSVVLYAGDTVLGGGVVV